MRVAMLGVGQMGAPMAERLLEAGFEVTISDPSDAAAAPLLERGARRARSPAEAASGADAALASLPDPQVSQAVALGPEGVHEARDLACYVEMSTIGSPTVEAIANALAERGIPVLDAPVSGGPRGARAGTLATMVAGPAEAFAAAEPALKAIAGHVFHVGDRPGQGQVAKLVNNMISGAAMAASFEAVTMGVKAGLDADELIALINVSTGRCGATLDKFPQSILTGSFDYGGRLGTMYKDLMLCLEEYRHHAVPHQASASATQLWFHGMARGWADNDYTSLIRLVEEWAGVEVRGRAARSGD